MIALRRGGSGGAAALVAAGALLGACRFPAQPPPGASGAEIYALQLCANCHGEQGEGKTQGPPLRGLSAHWSRDDLADFLAETDAWEERDERLARLAREYSGDMKPYDNLSPAERLRLADYLLAL
ncbi:MAG: cytochrome c [Planctomycetota bacterium]